ncbi:MAG: hypothetical protein LBQ57_09135 [Spirochaetales bacterium]|jgi:hypothetical protein|nr:hypothetical protein [Spirochaetales bacterium]
MKKYFLSLLVFALGIHCVFSQTSGSLPVKAAVLFTNGVGYFSREATVNGSGSLELYFNTKDINDLLKSMVVRDLDGGSITAVNYASREPLKKTLGGFSLDLSDDFPIAALLSQARGETVEINADRKYTGAILGTESRPVSTGPESPYRDMLQEEIYINLYAGEGLRSIPLKAVQSIQFQNPRLRQEFEEALALIAASRNTEKKSVLISCQGEGRRRVQAAYIAETPVWKTSYRLVAGRNGKHLLQGWGIVENTTDEDWKGIQLELISGMPVSFAMDLYQPLFNPRPFVPYSASRNLASQSYDQGFEPAMEIDEQARASHKESAADELFYESFAAKRAAPPPAPAENIAQGVNAAASADAVGEFFRYTIANPVDLPRGRSAMIPLLNEEIEGERLSVYNESVHAKHPMNGLLLKNTSALSLMGGPITVYEGGIYAGDARMESLGLGAQRLVSYSLDLSTEIASLGASQPEVISSVRLNRGILTASRTLRREHSYTLINRGEGSRTVVIEYPASADWKLAEPSSFAERTDSLYRFRVQTGAARDSQTVFRVAEERVLEQKIGLSNISNDTILFYSGQKNASSSVRSALEKLAALKNELADIARSRQAAEAQVSSIYREQERIRSNMDSLDRTSALYQRYAGTLGDQENTLADLAKTLNNLGKQETGKKKAIDDFLANLEVQ